MAAEYEPEITSMEQFLKQSKRPVSAKLNNTKFLKTNLIF